MSRIFSAVKTVAAIAGWVVVAVYVLSILF